MFFIPLPIILYRLKYDRTASIFVMMTESSCRCSSEGLSLFHLRLLLDYWDWLLEIPLQSEKSKLYTFMAIWTYASYTNNYELCCSCL